MHLLSPLSTSLLALTLALGTQGPSPGGNQALISAQRISAPCSYVGASHSMGFVPGMAVENTFVTSADPEVRRFIVYVPSSYQSGAGPYPVVYMLHGTGQTAGSPVSRLSWDELAEARDFIAVFPEALEYDLLDGTSRTKWHTNAVADFAVEPYELPLADDVLFLRELHNTLGDHLSIDCDRIYASGFSNGGGFIKTKIRVELGDIFAATSNSGGIGIAMGVPGEFFPVNGTDFRPHFEIVGSKDPNRKDGCVGQGDLLVGQDLPMIPADIIAAGCMWNPMVAMAFEMGMDESLYTTVEQPNLTQFLWSTETLIGPHPREYRFVVLRNLGHEYPSGLNYPVDFVPVYYDWMLQYTR
ncbi:MAG: hypothetical protein ACI8X5_003922 [Planctomycetota bacterium]|jgi:hypothetical protein